MTGPEQDYSSRQPQLGCKKTGAQHLSPCLALSIWQRLGPPDPSAAAGQLWV